MDSAAQTKLRQLGQPALGGGAHFALCFHRLLQTSDDVFSCWNQSGRQFLAVQLCRLVLGGSARLCPASAASCRQVMN